MLKFCGFADTIDCVKTALDKQKVCEKDCFTNLLNSACMTFETANMLKYLTLMTRQERARIYVHLLS